MIKYGRYILDRIPDERQVWHILLPEEPGGNPPYELSFCDGVFYPENFERIVISSVIPDLGLCDECIENIVKINNKEIITAEDWWGKMWDELIEEEKLLYRKIAGIC